MRVPLVCVLVAITACAVAQAADWKLAWSDEFNTPGVPDTSKWSREEGLIRNHEAQYYTKDRLENARVEGGNLVIECRKEPFSDAGHSARYTSASLTTEGKESWTYGRVEVRAKLPTGRGVWPAIWMLGENIHKVSWPKCGELDIMEFVGKEPESVHATVHYSKDSKHASSGSKTPIVDPAADFHVYAMEWSPERIDFFFDGAKYHSFLVDDAGTGADNPFRKPQFLILNFALGGDWGGPIDDSVLPQKFVIDYVRVYQQALP